VRRNAVIVVAAFGESGVDQRRLSSGDRQPVDTSIAIEEERGSVARPVGRFKAFGCDVHYVPDGRCNGHSFQRTVERRFRGRGQVCRQLDICERGLLHYVFIVRADPNTYIVSSLQGNRYRSAGVVQFLATVSQKQIDEIVWLLHVESFRARKVRLGLMSLDRKSVV